MSNSKGYQLYNQMLGYDPETIRKLNSGSAWSVFGGGTNPDGTADTDTMWENQWMRGAFSEWYSKNAERKQKEDLALANQKRVNREAADAREAAAGTTGTTGTTTAPTTSTTGTPITTLPVGAPTTSSPYSTSTYPTVSTTSGLFSVPSSTPLTSLGQSINNSNAQIGGYLSNLTSAAQSGITSAGDVVNNLGTQIQNANYQANQVLEQEKAAREQQQAELRAAEADSAGATLQSYLLEEGARQRTAFQQRQLDEKLAEQKKRLMTSRRMLATNKAGGGFLSSIRT